MQTPPLHTLPPLQSVCDVHGQGPLVPPQAWQWFAAQVCPVAQSAVFVHSGIGVQAPAVHCWPLTHWLDVVHGQAPASPPHAVQLPDVHVVPAAQSFAPVQCTAVPPSVLVGGTQMFALQTVPRAHVELDVQVATHPSSVQTCPVLQLVSPVQLVVPGGVIVVQP